MIQSSWDIKEDRQERRWSKRQGGLIIVDKTDIMEDRQKRRQSKTQII